MKPKEQAVEVIWIPAGAEQQDNDTFADTFTLAEWEEKEGELMTPNRDVLPTLEDMVNDWEMGCL